MGIDRAAKPQSQSTKSQIPLHWRWRYIKRLIKKANEGKIPPSAVFAAFALADCLYQHDTVEVSHSFLANRVGLHRVTVSKGFDALERDGDIVVLARGRFKGKHAKAIEGRYALGLTPADRGEKESEVAVRLPSEESEVAVRLPSEVAEGQPSEVAVRLHNTTTSASSSEAEVVVPAARGAASGAASRACGGFEAFKRVYPKMERVDEAESAFAAAVASGASPEFIAAQAAAFAAVKANVDPRWIPDACAWLRKRRYEGKYPQPQQREARGKRKGKKAKAASKPKGKRGDRKSKLQPVTSIPPQLSPKAEPLPEPSPEQREREARERHERHEQYKRERKEREEREQRAREWQRQQEKQHREWLEEGWQTLPYARNYLHKTDDRFDITLRKWDEGFDAEVAFDTYGEKEIKISDLCATIEDAKATAYSMMRGWQS